MEISRAWRRHHWWRLGLVTTAVTGLAAAGGLVASAAPLEGDIVGANSANAIANSYIVVLKPAASKDVAAKSRAIASQVNAQIKHTYSAAVQGFSASMNEVSARRLAAHSDVAYVQQNQEIRLDDTQPNPPSWGLDRIDQRPLPLDNSYTYPSTASGVHAYIIDTGIRQSHNDFGGRAIPGTDTITPGGTADDCDGHGTHVAGTVGGTAHGVAKGVTLVAVRVLNCAGSGTTASVVAGVDWVTANAIKPAVANMSLGGSADQALDNAVANSIASGITYTLSAGNANANACGQSPARVASGITVGATDRNDNRASFSNFGGCVDVFAPGVAIISASNGSNSATQSLSGTSMAAPHVAGAAALVLAANPGFSPTQVASSLTGSASPSTVVNRGTDSPNRLLYTGSDPTPPPAPNDFDLRASEARVVTTPGRPVSTSVQTSTIAGSSQLVNFSAIDLPTGVTVSFSPSSVFTGDSTAANFTVSGSATPGMYTVAVVATGSSMTHRLSVLLNISNNQGTYYPLTPSRILDTRSGNGAPVGALGPDSTISLQVNGRGGVPGSGVSAVVLNVTSTGATVGSFVTVYPSGVVRPIASSLNISPGWTGANSVSVAVGTDGKVNIYNNAGSTHIIADVVGFYAKDASVVPTMGNVIGGEYQPIIPGRLFDSRVDWEFGKLPAGDTVLVGANFGSINRNIRAFVVNVTAVDPSADGYLTTWSGTGPPPGTSTLNYKRGDPAVPNMAVVPVSFGVFSDDPTIPSIAAFTQEDTHVIIDIMGFIDDSKLGGLRFTARTPIRIADTRQGQPVPALGIGTTAVFPAPPAVAPAGTEGLALNVTAVFPTKDTFLSVWPNGIPGVTQPFVSNLNPRPGTIIPNSVYTLVGPTKAFNIYNSDGTTNVVVDVVGTFWDPLVTPGGPGTLKAELSGMQQWRLVGSQSKLQVG